MKKIETICVLGGGHGAHGLSADLALRDFRVRMCESPDFAGNIRKVLETGKIELSGIREGLAALEFAGTDYAEAVSGAEIVFIVVPAFAHPAVFRSVAPHLKKGQVVVFTPGNLSSLMAYETLKRMGKESDVVVAETSTLPYGVRMIEEGHVRIIIDAVANPLAAMPGGRTDEILEPLRSLYPAILNGDNVLKVAISNPNPSAHPVATMLNTGRIEFADTFYLYREASPHRSTASLGSLKRREPPCWRSWG